MKKIGFALIILTVIFIFVSSASAFTMVKTDTDTITTAQRDTAIARGLRWLANQQKSDGHFEDPAHPGYYPVALTAFAVLKFEDHAARLGKNPFDTTYEYHQKVDSGWIYLSTQLLTHTPMNDQNSKDPEQYTDNDNYGIYFSSPEPVYDIGVVMMALQASVSPDRVFPNHPIYATTFKDVLEDCVDWCAWAQCDGGSGRGGWKYQRYDNASGLSDNSVSPWPVLGLMSAQAWGIKAPDFVKTELEDYWLDYSQEDASGCFGYTMPGSYTSGGPFAVTAGGLIELTYCDVPTSDARWSAASQCICDHWNDGSCCNIGNLYAMYALMKAAMTVYPPVWDFGDLCPMWQPVYDSVLLAVQDTTSPPSDYGSWPASWALPWHSPAWNKVLSTELALLILQKVAPPPSPTGKVFIPNTDTCVNPGDYVTLPILLQNNPVPFGGFELEVEFDYTAMTFVGAEMGELLTDLDSLDGGPPPPKHYSWEYFQYRMLPCPLCACCKYKILLLGMMDLPNGSNNVGVPIPENSDGELVLLHFVVNNDENLRGFKIPVCWEWEGTVQGDSLLIEDWDCNENTFSSEDGNILYVSKLLCQYRDSLCDAPTGGIEPVLVFQNGICGQNCGGVDVCPAGPNFCKRGDVNYNTLPYEVADAVLFASYFAEGLNVFSADPNARAYQICATDVNADGRALTLSDLVYLIRVILHDAVEIPKLAPSSENVNVIISNHTITIECAGSIGAILFEFDGAVVPTLLADKMEMIAKDNKVLVWSREGHSLESTAQVVSFEGDANLTSVTAVDRDSRELKTSINAKVAPLAFALHPAYPNPFNPSTNLSFTLPVALNYSLKIFNVTGQLVKSYEGMGKVGLNVITWDSKDNAGDEVASGIYFYQLTAGSFSATQKMVVVK